MADLRLGLRLGRPFKGRKRRMQITIYADMEVLEALNELVNEKQRQGERGASRSEEYNRAMRKYLQELGKLPPED